ncbi:MAG TPA: hypothetical protein VGY58_14000, partial [Gemmataceae bacterium]|nr:hypothetical protein [Gemmataceae bacterium]
MQHSIMQVKSLTLFRAFLFALSLTLSVATASALDAQGQVVRMGTSGSVTGEKDGGVERGALDELQSLIGEMTGLRVAIVREQDWRELTARLVKTDLQMGIFQGYEFAWAQHQDPRFKPLVVAIDTYVYPIVYAVVRRENPAGDFAGLRGQSLCLPDICRRHIRLFV